MKPPQEPHENCISYVVGSLERASIIYLRDGRRIRIVKGRSGRVRMTVEDQDTIKLSELKES